MPVHLSATIFGTSWATRFCSREWTAPPVRGDFGALDRKAIEDAKLTVTYAEGPALIGGHGFTTGHIDQTSFEKLLSPSAMKIGVDHGMGCYRRPVSGAGRNASCSKVMKASCVRTRSQFQ